MPELVLPLEGQWSRLLSFPSSKISLHESVELLTVASGGLVLTEEPLYGVVAAEGNKSEYHSVVCGHDCTSITYI